MHPVPQCILRCVTCKCGHVCQVQMRSRVSGANAVTCVRCKCGHEVHHMRQSVRCIGYVGSIRSINEVESLVDISHRATMTSNDISHRATLTSNDISHRATLTSNDISHRATIDSNDISHSTFFWSSFEPSHFHTKHSPVPK